MINSKIALSLASIAAAGALVAGATFAFFTDEDVSNDNAFTAGTINIDLIENVTGSLPFNVTGMLPGDRATECAGVSNIGSLDFNWQFNLNQTAAGTPDLNDVLKSRIQVWTGGGVPTGPDCADDLVDTNWTEIFNGFISESTNPDQMGLLADGSTVYFRLTAYLPDDLATEFVDVDDNLYQGGSATYQFEVEAFQTDDPSYGTAD